jgi:type II secretory pathway pseudopilin PulG
VSLPRRTGFSIVDLLIIGAIVLVLGAILIPRFAASRQGRISDAVSAELRALRGKEADYHRVHGAYTNDRAALGLSDSGEVVVTIQSASPTGWSATARHRTVGLTCTLWVGSARMERGQEGEPTCD